MVDVCDNTKVSNIFHSGAKIGYFANRKGFAAEKLWLLSINLQALLNKKSLQNASFDFCEARPGFEPRSAEGGYEDFLRK
jgi:hypothetical protein